MLNRGSSQSFLIIYQPYYFYRSKFNIIAVVIISNILFTAYKLFIVTHK